MQLINWKKEASSLQKVDKMEEETPRRCTKHGTKMLLLLVPNHTFSSKVFPRDFPKLLLVPPVDFSVFN